MVLRWGTVGQDVHNNGDIIPHAFCVERNVVFELKTPHYQYITCGTECGQPGGNSCDECEGSSAAVCCNECEQSLCGTCAQALHRKGSRARHELIPIDTEEKDEDDEFVIKVSRRTKVDLAVQFKTRADSNRMLYAVKAGRNTSFEETDWKQHATVAWTHFRERSGFKQTTSHSGPRLFGIQCGDVQKHLALMRTSNPETKEQKETLQVTAKRKSNTMKRVSLKEVVRSLIQKARASRSSFETQVVLLLVCGLYAGFFGFVLFHWFSGAPWHELLRTQEQFEDHSCVLVFSFENAGTHTHIHTQHTHTHSL